MKIIRELLGKLPWIIILIACLTLGLAPFVPEPHLVEKIKMLANGQLTKPIDIVDLFIHSTPFILAGLKLVVTPVRR